MNDPEEIERQLFARYSKAAYLRLCGRIGNDPQNFSTLLSLLGSDNPATVLRASWLMSMCTDRHPDLILPHLPALLRLAARKGANDSLRRNIVRALQFIEIPKKLRGRAAELCFMLLQDVQTRVAVKAFSMTVLANIAASEPDLKNEIALVIEQMLPYGSAGIRSRGAKVLKQMRK